MQYTRYQIPDTPPRCTPSEERGRRRCQRARVQEGASRTTGSRGCQLSPSSHTPRSLLCDLVPVPATRKRLSEQRLCVGMTESNQPRSLPSRLGKIAVLTAVASAAWQDLRCTLRESGQNVDIRLVPVTVDPNTIPPDRLDEILERLRCEQADWEKRNERHRLEYLAWCASRRFFAE